MLTLLEEMNEIKGISSKIQLVYPRNSVGGSTVPLRKAAVKF